MVDVRFIDVYMVLREAKVYVIAVRARYEKGGKRGHIKAMQTE